MKHLTHLQAFASLVLLTAAGIAGAAPNPGPARMAQATDGAFAFDLYRQLAAEGPGKNLFCSPFSLSSALAMTAEGARGETALQMGQALRFPQGLRRTGEDARLVPWQMRPIHAGTAALNDPSRWGLRA